MTTIPTHNIIMQQSVAAHDATHQGRPLQPDPGQAAAQQALKEVVEKTTVKESEEYENLKSDKNNSELEFKKKKKKKKKKELLKKNQDPEAPGTLLDTVI